MKPRRNDPCPCGSGRKYKHCCQTKSAAKDDGPNELKWRRLNRLLAESRTDLLRFVTREYGPGVLDEAWEEFTLEVEGRFDPGSHQLPLFMPWFYNCWSPDAQETRVSNSGLHGVSPVIAYLRDQRVKLDPMLRSYLESCAKSPFSFFDILSTNPGRGMRLRNIFTGEERDVAERTASTTLLPGDILFAQLAGVENIVMIEACAPFAIPPIWKGSIIDLRKRIGTLSDPEELREWDLEFLDLYHEITGRLFNPQLPQLANTDGEPLVLLRLVFDIESTQATFDALKHLTLDESDEALLKDAERDSKGDLISVRFDWKKRGNRQHGHLDNTILGFIEIRGNRLTIDVNSEKRAAAARKTVEKALGDRVKIRATEIQSIEKMLGDVANQGGGDPRAMDPETEALNNLPEVRARIEEMMERHYEGWVNERLPALGGKTPMQAMKDPDGREMVEALLLQIERDGKGQSPPLGEAIVQRLRSRLGLTR